MTAVPNFEQKVQSGLDLPDERKFYFNGVTVSISPPDVIIVLQHNDKPIAFLNASHSTAKTLVELLGTLLQDFENKSEQKIYTFGDYQEKLENG